jgi:hypothetical protein
VSQRLSFQYQDDHGPVVEVQLDAAGHLLRVTGMVDSGASTSSFPLGLATLLEIPFTQLVQGEDATGVGSTFETWTCPTPITGQIIAYIQPPGQAKRIPTLWGPVFPLSPMFIQPDDILFGRADFFQAFTVSFELNHNPFGLFHLDY